MSDLKLRKISFIDNNKLSIHLSDGRKVVMPLSKFPSFSKLSNKQRQDFEIIDDHYLSFLTVDEVLRIEEMQARYLTVKTLWMHEYENEVLSSAVGPGSGYAFIKQYFPQARHTIRISSAYFKLQGFQLGREYVRDEVVYRILVGRGDKANVQETVLSEITEEMRRSEAILTDIVRELVSRIEKGRFFIKSASSITQLYHCKFYICDDVAGYHGSSNFTSQGIKENGNAEQVSLFPNREDIRNFTAWFDAVAEESDDLLQPLLKLLKLWLDMAKPFAVYIKTLQLILNQEQDKSYSFAPTFFQSVVIEAAWRQLNKYGGAFIVAATGLGKTIMGAEVALRFREKRKRSNFFIVIAPSLVRDKWQKQFQERRITPDFYGITIPFSEQKDNPRHEITRLKRLLDRADENTLIIIDEVQHYRNEQSKERIRKEHISRVYELLEPPVTERGANIVLLTATAYGTTLDNLNGLLRLLPYRKSDNQDDTDRWQVSSVNDFVNLDIVNILSIAHVLTIARRLGDVDDEQPFFRYNDERVYLPKQLKLQRIFYDLPFEKEILSAFDQNCFSQREGMDMGYIDENDQIVRVKVDSVYGNALDDLLSSSQAFARSVGRNLATPDLDRNSTDESLVTDDPDEEVALDSTPYVAPLKLSLDKRKKLLISLYKKLTSLDLDPKLQELIKLITRHQIKEGKKILIFIRRHPTALYLLNRIKKYYGKQVRVKSLIRRTEKGYQLRDRKERDKILCEFSPSSFPEEKPSGIVDVLICTDADGLGIDLPEVDVTVNYDLPEAADILFQRAGRTLRMTNQKGRLVIFYTFIPNLINKTSKSRCHYHIINRFNRVMMRHSQAKKVLKASVLSEEVQDNIFLNDIVIDDTEGFIKQADLTDNVLTSIKKSWIEHELILSKYGKKKEYADLPDFLHSARHYEGDSYLVYVLIQHETQYKVILYNVNEQIIESKNELDILNLIVCEPTTEKAFINTEIVEELGQRAISTWCGDNAKQSHKISESEIEKWCVMVMIPEGIDDATAIRDFAKAKTTKEKSKRRRQTSDKKKVISLTEVLDKEK